MKKIFIFILFMCFVILLNAGAGAIFLPKYNFEDMEYLKITEALDKNSIKYFVFSDTDDSCLGLYGTKVLPYVTIDSIDTDIIDFMIIIDGPGIIPYLDNKKLINIIKKINDEGKIIGALKMAPALFMSADLVKGKKLNLFLNDFLFNKYKDYGVQYVSYDVYIIENLITAYDDRFIDKFMYNFLEELNKEEDENNNTTGE